MNFMRVYQHNMPLGSAQSFPVLPNGEGVGVRQNPSNSPERIQNTKAQWTCSPVEITYTTQPVSHSAIQAVVIQSASRIDTTEIATCMHGKQMKFSKQ